MNTREGKRRIKEGMERGQKIETLQASSVLQGNRRGEGGIRTHDAQKGHTGFRDRLLQPLGHLSQ